jgi:hypothetical protein
MDLQNKLGFAGKYYDNVSVEKIEKLTLPVHFTGSDYIPLTPKDTDCSFNYLRLLSEDPIYIDTGHCGQTLSKIKNTYKWVCFNRDGVNTDTLILMFQKLFDSGFKIRSIQKDPNKLMKSECNLTFDVKLKGWVYFSIDFELTEKYNNCLINNCI